ncbi:MAG: hypothetical protein PHY93_01140 [Bacteriovorax sp.]|nr:hypothetical protein [Bacteriovorax sp.]
MAYLYIFFQSNILEMPAYFLFLKSKRSKWNFFERFIFVTGLNAITHPIVFFLIMNLRLTYLQNILLAEAFAIFTEAMILKLSLKEKFMPCLFISTFANLLSWQLAPMFTYLFWPYLK